MYLFTRSQPPLAASVFCCVSGSTDDYKANEMTYKWEEISGPLETRMHPSFEQVLYLKNLVAGTYIIK